METQFDPKIVKVLSALKQVEGGDYNNRTGDGGSSAGAYQWNNGKKKLAPNEIPINFQNMAKSHGLNPTDFSPANQNKVAYFQVKKWKDNGLQPDEIAALWNGAKKDPTTGKFTYINPQYGVKFRNALQVGNTPTVPPAPAPTASEMADEEGGSRAWFPSKTTDSALTAGLKTAGNVLPSAFGFAKNVIKSLNPVEIVNNIRKIPGEFKALAEETGGVKNAFNAFAKELPGTAYESFVPEAARAIVKGDLETAKRSVTNDPFGQVAPFVFAAKGLAKGADTLATKRAMSNYVKEPYTTKTIPKPSTTFDTAFEKGVGATSGAVTKPLGFVANKIGSGVADATRAGIAQVTGLNKETIPQIIKSPEAFTKKSMASTDRASLGRQVQSELGKLAEEKSATGKEYEPIRANQNPIKVDSDFFDNTIKETTGLKIKAGKLIADTNSKIRDPGDVRALQKVYDLYNKTFKKGTMTTNEYLNLREDLAKAAKFEKDIGVRKDVQILSGQIRAKLNEAYRPQVEGLKNLDATMSEQIQQYKELAKGLVDRDGTITDAGMARIANLSKNKPNLAAQLEKIVPGITEQVKNLQAIVDIERASGIKVGTYTKGAIVGGGLAFGGPIQAIINMILTSPQFAVPILRRYGLLKNSAAVKAVMNALKQGGSAVNNIGATASPYMSRDITTIKPKIGLGIEDVSNKSIKSLPKNLKITDAYGNSYMGFNIKYFEKLANEKGYPLYDKLVKVEALPTQKAKINAMNNILDDLTLKGKGVVAPEKTITEPIKVYRGEGKGIGNSTLVKGQYFADSKKFAGAFGNVTEHTIPASSKIFDLDNIKSGKIKVPEKILMDQEALTEYIIDKGFDYTKNTNTRGVEYVKLNKLNTELKNLAKKSQTLAEFKSKVMDNWEKFREEINRMSKDYTNADNSRLRSPMEDIWNQING